MKKLIFASAFAIAILGAFASKTHRSKNPMPVYLKVAGACTDEHDNISCHVGAVQSCKVGTVDAFQSDCSILTKD